MHDHLFDAESRLCVYEDCGVSQNSYSAANGLFGRLGMRSRSTLPPLDAVREELPRAPVPDFYSEWR